MAHSHRAIGEYVLRRGRVQYKRDRKTIKDSERVDLKEQGKEQLPDTRHGEGCLTRTVIFTEGCSQPTVTLQEYIIPNRSHGNECGKKLNAIFHTGQLLRGQQSGEVEGVNLGRQRQIIQHTGVSVSTNFCHNAKITLNKRQQRFISHLYHVIQQFNHI